MFPTWAAMVAFFFNDRSRTLAEIGAMTPQQIVGVALHPRDDKGKVNLDHNRAAGCEVPPAAEQKRRHLARWGVSDPKLQARFVAEYFERASEYDAGDPGHD